MLILHETYDHWSVAVLTVTAHSSFFPTFDFFFKICCFLHWIQSVNPHFYVTLYYNGSPYICPVFNCIFMHVHILLLLISFVPSGQNGSYTNFIFRFISTFMLLSYVLLMSRVNYSLFLLVHILTMHFLMFMYLATLFNLHHLDEERFICSKYW